MLAVVGRGSGWVAAWESVGKAGAPACVYAAFPNLDIADNQLAIAL